MANYANQKRITVEARKTRHPYGIFNIDALQQAMSTIKTVGGIKIWMYINKNSDNYTFDLSRAELLKHWGLTRDTYDSGIAELMKLGYLTPINDNEKTLLFHEMICAENPQNTETLAENQIETIVQQICEENQHKETVCEENLPNQVDNTENRNNWSVNGFYF